MNSDIQGLNINIKKREIARQPNAVSPSPVRYNEDECLSDNSKLREKELNSPSLIQCLKN